MAKNRIDIYKEFAKQIEYPMIVFEAESGLVLDMNYDAEVLIGAKAENIKIEPGRVLTTTNFWELLHGKKNIIWHRIRLIADGKEVMVSGLVNEMSVDGTVIYTMLFERRSDLNIGSLTLERIVNHANIVALNLYFEDKSYKIDYISQNINRYGYTRAQLYEGLISYESIICEEDILFVKSKVAETIRKKIEEGIIECRLRSEQNELIPVRLLIHYVYNDYGMISSLEILVVDLTEEIRKNRERNYLNLTISKMKSVVLVKTYKENKRTLRYISPNANMVGMDTEKLVKKYKLTEDYIHPEDRDGVVDGIYSAIENGVTDYTTMYRMISDEGKQIWVENVVTISHIADGEAEISFLLTDITEQKELEQELAATVDEKKTEGIDYKNATIENEDEEMIKRFQLVADAVGVNASHYAVLLDLKGVQLTKPQGPLIDMGLFYDMFERPVFKENFANIAKSAQEDAIPQSCSFDMDNRQVHVVFAPIIMATRVTAYWVMASFEKDGMGLLSSVVESQWHLMNSVAKCFYADSMVEMERHNRKLKEMKLSKEKKEKELLQELIGLMAESGASAIGEICQKVGAYLQISDIGVYTKNATTGDMDSYFEWSQSVDNGAFFRRMAASASEYEAIKIHFEREGILVADKNLQDPFLKDLVARTGMGAIMLVNLKNGDMDNGYVMFANKTENTEFDKHTIGFAKDVTNLISCLVSKQQNGNSLELLHEGFLEAYNHMRDAVFVKNNRTGEIIFANKATEKLFGYSLEGRQAGEFVNDQYEQYRSLAGIRRRLIADKKIIKWQSYMKELDQIMNIVEVHLDTISGTDCSLIVLKKNKNKDKKK